MARDSLGIFADWGAFRDDNIPRCYAISKPFQSTGESEYEAFASIGSWPLRRVRGQVHFRLSRQIAPRSAVTLSVGNRTFALSAGGGDAWARDATMDAAIVAAMRSAETMSVRARDTEGRAFTDSYRLTGAASAMDAAILGCARSHTSTR